MRFTPGLAAIALLAPAASAAPPAQGPPPPPEFAEQQSASKPPPFPAALVDQGTTDPRLQGMFAPEGFRVEIVAEAPTVVNPVGFTFAPDGTLFVIEWKPDLGKESAPFFETIRYRDGTTRVVNTMKKFEVDAVKQLTRNPKTGLYDRAEVVLTDELPSSVMFHDGWLYTASRGTVRRYKKSAPTSFTGGNSTSAATQVSNRWDTRETIAQGFCGFHHHQVSGLTMGPDGWLYITTGDDDNIVEGADGGRATVMRTGAVFRCLPDGSKMEPYSLGYRNPYRGIVNDDRFNWFHADNDQEDGSKFTGCRLMHVAEESDYGWRLKPGARCCVTDFLRGAVAGERPGKLPPMLKTGRGAPAGVLIYNDTQLPPQYRGLMYYPDVFRKLVRAYRLAPKGSTFEIDAEMEFLKSADPLFRPCQMEVGPDGAIYVCDWRTDSGGAGKIWGDGTHGRIYRLTWVGAASLPPIPPRPVEGWAKLFPVFGKPAAIPDVLNALHSPDATTRERALAELARRSKPAEAIRAMKEADRGFHLEPAAFVELIQPLVGEDEKLPVRLAGYFLLQRNWSTAVAKLFLHALDDKEVDIRRVAAEGLGRNVATDDLEANLALAKALGDEVLSVRRAAALALGRMKNEGGVDPLIAAWRADATGDPFLHDAYLRGLERVGAKGIGGLLALAASGEAADWSRVVGAFLALRSRPAADALPELLASPHLTAEQRAALVRSYLNYQFDPPLPLDPLAKFLTARPDEPPEVKIAGLEVLAASNALGGPEPAKFAADLVFAEDDALRLAAIAAIEQGRVVPAAAALRRALFGEKRPAAERLALMKAVRAIASADCGATSLVILESKDEPAALKAEALRCLANHDPAKARELAVPFLDGTDPLLVAEAVATLGTTEEGALVVGRRYVEKKLPKDLYPRVSEVLRKFPKNPEIAKLNAEVMRGGLLLSTAPGEIDKIRAMVQLKGDAKRGRAVYLNTALVACASCHKLEGVGGQVGPDLTRVWETSTIEKLVESIVDPSKEIKEGFTAYKAVTVNGQVFTGLKVTDTPAEVVLREATGRDVRIDRKDLDELTPSKVSLMPENVVSQLSFEQFIDLLAFLKSRKEQELLRGAVLEYSVLVGAPKGIDTPDAFERKPDPGTAVPGVAALWQTVPADAGGLLALKPLVPPDGATGVYATAAVYSPAAQKATMVVLRDDPIRITLNGREAFFGKVIKSLPFGQEERATVELAAGWNQVLVKVETKASVHKLGLQFQGEGIKTSAAPQGK